MKESTFNMWRLVVTFAIFAYKQDFLIRESVEKLFGAQNVTIEWIGN